MVKYGTIRIPGYLSTPCRQQQNKENTMHCAFLSRHAGLQSGALRRALLCVALLPPILVAPIAEALTLTGATLRKTHAAATLDIAVDITQSISGPVSIEPRAIGGGHQIVVQFDAPITVAGTARVTDESGATLAVASATQNGNAVTVTINPLADNRRLTIMLTGVNTAGNDFAIAVGFLAADVNRSGTVTSGDLSAVKARAGQPADAANAANAAYDVNATGAVTASDIAAVKARDSRTLPPAYTIGGTLSGMTGTIVLMNNGANNFSFPANGPFTFPVAASGIYNLGVFAAPPGQECAVTNGTGTIGGVNVTNIAIACEPLNISPVINSVAPTIATEDTLYTYNATRTDGDGPSQIWSLLGSHTCGGSIVAGTGAFTFTPVGPVPLASCVVAIQVCDNGTPNLCATQTTTVTITAINDAPSANAVSVNALAAIPVTYAAGTLGGTDPEGTAVTINTGSAASLINLQSVTLNANGSFTFTPTPGFAGSASFTYTVTDAGAPGPNQTSAPATVNVTVNGPPTHFILSTGATTAACGNLNNPCTLAQALINIGSAINRQIFIADSNTHSTPVTLNAGESVYGQGVTGANFATVLGYNAALAALPAGASFSPLPAINQARPTVTSAGTTITLNANNTLRGLNLGSSGGTTLTGTSFGTLTASEVSITSGLPALNLVTGTAAVTFDSLTATGGATGVNLNALTGSLTINGGAISGSTNTAFAVTGGTGNVTYAGSVAAGAGVRSVNIANKTAGIVNFNGAVGGTGTGVSLTTNTGATINFNGGLNLSTGANAAFTATGGGTVNATQNNTSIVNTLATTTGTALNVTNMTFGATGLTFRSISSNGGANGILLQNTTGSFTVTGNSSGNCGGLVVNNATAPTAPALADCTGGTIQNKATGIRLDNVQSVSLTRMRVTGTVANNFGIYGTSVNGFTLAHSVIDGSIGATTGAQDAPLAFGKSNPSGLNGLSGVNSITDSTISGGIEHNLEFYSQSGSANLTIARTVVISNSAAGGSDGILMEMQGTANATALIDNSYFNDNKSQAMQAAANDNSIINLTVRNSKWTRTTQGNEGVVFSNGSNGQLTLNVANNIATGFGGVAIFVGQTAGNATAASKLHATIQNNTVTAPTTATNHAIISFLTSTVGAGATARIRVNNNNVTQNSTTGVARGILIDTPDASTNPNYHATVSGNTVAGTDTVVGVGVLVVQSRQSSTGCMSISGNNASVATAGVTAIRARQVAPATASLSGSGATSATVLAANNPASTTEVLGTIALTGAACLLPDSPTLP